MRLQKVINIEDNVMKHSNIARELDRYGVNEVFWAKNAEEGIKEIQNAIKAGIPYQLLILDMHFSFQGKDDLNAGEKTVELLHNEQINLPIILCSSQNWNIRGVVDHVFYHERRDWEDDLEQALQKVEGLLERRNS